MGKSYKKEQFPINIRLFLFAKFDCLGLTDIKQFYIKMPKTKIKQFCIKMLKMMQDPGFSGFICLPDNENPRICKLGLYTVYSFIQCTLVQHTVAKLASFSERCQYCSLILDLLKCIFTVNYKKNVSSLINFIK